MDKKLEELAIKITSKIMIFAINNNLLDKNADEIIKAYKKSIKGGE